MLHRLRQWICPDLAIDLGTANTIVSIQGEGIALDEPSVVALHKGSRKILGNGTAVGKLAKQMLGRTPDSIIAVRPLKEGVITDFELCEAMLRYFIHKARHHSRGLRPRVVIAVPGSITPVEKRAVFNSAERAGAGRVYLIDESKAAGIGAGLPISEPMASMVCDIGGGTSEVAIMSMGDTVVSNSVRIGGDKCDEAIVEYMKQHFSMRIGVQTAEDLKLELGSAYPLEQELTGEVKGLDIISSIPRKAIVTSEELRDALHGPLESILNCCKQTIEQCKPELVADLADNGMVLTGGGALLRGIAFYMSEQLGIPVRVDEDPLRTVARGTAICLEHLSQWRHAFDNGDGDFLRDGPQFMKRETRSSEIKLALLAILTGICLYAVPSACSDRVSNLIRDVSKPGLILVQQFKDWQTQTAEVSPELSRVEQLETRLSELQQENRRLELQSLQLTEDLQYLKQTGVPSYQTQTGERLLVPDLIEAELLGQSSIALLKEGQLLNQGRERGVFESSFVLQSELPLIDQGTRQGVQAGFSLYAGQTVVGKISEVGRWTSSLIPITSVDYRGSARIARKTEQGLQLGTDGILVGMGEGKCQLLQVPPTESIQVGQDVYTGEVDRELPLNMQSTLGQPMYYGRVIEAELPRGAPYWKIIVQPAVKLAEVKQVSVLRKIVNPRRMLAN